MTQPETRYATVGDERIAYQVSGEGSCDLVATPGQWGHLDLAWEDPATARFFRRLATYSRLIRFDTRGSGLSDPRPSDGRAEWEHWFEDLTAVMDAAGSRSAAILAWAGGAQFALQFAAVSPERVRALILINAVARRSAAPDYPQGATPEAIARFLDFARKFYGTEKWARVTNPTAAEDERVRRWLAKYARATASPKKIVESLANQMNMDVRQVLGTIRAPTLVMVRRNQRWEAVPQARYVADHIPGAHLVELPGVDTSPVWETPDIILDHIEEFLTGFRQSGAPDRMLVAVVFTDIVKSTERAASVGDAAWRALLDRHDDILRGQVRLYGGRLVDHAGDGSLSTFENPRRAIDCALALHGALRDIGVRVRVGVHFGEVERREDGGVGGVAVHVGARVMACARAGEVLVSRTLRDILIGSSYRFTDHGAHEFKGVPDRWQLYGVKSG